MSDRTFVVDHIKFQEPTGRMPVSKEKIRQYASNIRVEFPDTYVELCARHGGNVFARQNDIHRYYRSEENSLISASVFALIHYGDKDDFNYIGAQLDLTMDEVNGLLPFATSFEFNYWCLDFRETTQDPPVVYFDRRFVHIGDSDEELERWKDEYPWFRSVYPAADSFDDFLRGLTSSEKIS